MGAKHLSPDLQQEAAAMLAAGWTQAAVANHLGISVSSVRRIQERYRVKKGAVKACLIDQAQADLMDSADGERLKQMTAALLVDEVVQTRQLRDTMALALEEIHTDPNKVSMIMRAAAAYSTALKNTSDMLRKSTCTDETTGHDLPTLTIHELTNDMAERIIERRGRSKELGAMNLAVEVALIEAEEKKKS